MNNKTVTENRCPVCGLERGQNHAIGCVMGDIRADSQYLQSQLNELLKQGSPVEE